MSAALTFTADHTTNQLTIPAHGLNTGDGPAALMNVGGLLPTGLAPVTDVFVIRVDANTVKVAASSTLANAGTALTFADNGSGTNTLLIGVPYRRPRTYAFGVQLDSRDLNANFDTWGAFLWPFLTGQPQSLLDGPTFAGPLIVGGQLLPFADFTFTANSATDVLTATAHPLHTGAGPVQTTNAGGGLPGGLAAATSYFAIKIDANSFKLATSLANAIAGIAIDITSNGTGTQTLNHQPTTTRISDATVTRNLTVGGTAKATAYTFAAAQPVIYPGSAFIIQSGTPTRSGNVWTFPTSSTAEIICPIWYPPGTVISTLAWSFNRNSTPISGEFDFKLIKRSFGDGGLTTANVYSDVVSSGTAFTTRDTVAAFAPYTFEAGFIYHLSVATASTPFSGAPSFDGVKVAIDR